MKTLWIYNLGGPRNSSEIKDFLTDLLTDPYVFDLPLPEFLRYRLAVFVAEKRVNRIKNVYASMGFQGGGSPLVSETERQARCIEKELNKISKNKWKVKYAMACGYPNLRDLSSEELTPSKINFHLPLYPHYSRSTILSLRKLIQKKIGFDPVSFVGWIDKFYQDVNYLNASANLIEDFFEAKLERSSFLDFKPEKIENWKKEMTLVYSAHGIPLRLIKKGDTYRTEVEENVDLLQKMLIKKGFEGDFFLSFQSRLGPTKWTEPNTIDMLKKLGRRGVKKVAVIPISFVSDHLETLEEIGKELKEVAIKSGIEKYYRIPAPSCYPSFISSLAHIIVKEEKRIDANQI